MDQNSTMDESLESLEPFWWIMNELIGYHSVRPLDQNSTMSEDQSSVASNSASGDAELVSGVFVTVNGESLESKSRALEQEP